MVDEAQKNVKKLLLFKVDFEKVYDSVNLNYLEVVIAKMNFLVLWGNGFWNVFPWRQHQCLLTGVQHISFL